RRTGLASGWVPQGTAGRLWSRDEANTAPHATRQTLPTGEFAPSRNATKIAMRQHRTFWPRRKGLLPHTKDAPAGAICSVGEARAAARAPGATAVPTPGVPASRPPPNESPCKDLSYSNCSLDGFH